MDKQPRNESGGEERNKSVANIGSIYIAHLQGQSGGYFRDKFGMKRQHEDSRTV